MMTPETFRKSLLSNYWRNQLKNLWLRTPIPKIIKQNSCKDSDKDGPSTTIVSQCTLCRLYQ